MSEEEKHNGFDILLIFMLSPSRWLFLLFSRPKQVKSKGDSGEFGDCGGDEDESDEFGEETINLSVSRIG